MSVSGSFRYWSSRLILSTLFFTCSSLKAAKLNLAIKDFEESNSQVRPETHTHEAFQQTRVQGLFVHLFLDKFPG
ncbi:hypothetical protein GQ44DRAFT_247949 [Phaeosphaeriaceae sp. PMI808]|nr:hypothetical protein GQ44DRAFT_247949 [Phaeosphaeriaceae sp. PMI808]